MMWLKGVDLRNNRFAGALPVAWSRWRLLDVLAVSNNHFEGAIPSLDVEACFLSSNPLAGSIPLALLDARGHHSTKAMLAIDLLHE
eukprot:3120549-Amphidinium_carterae.1